MIKIKHKHNILHCITNLNICLLALLKKKNLLPKTQLTFLILTEDILQKVYPLNNHIMNNYKIDFILNLALIT